MEETMDLDLPKAVKKHVKKRKSKNPLPKEK
jgi:hypothetical protein